MRNFESFNSVINYIEDNLKNEINSCKYNGSFGI